MKKRKILLTSVMMLTMFTTVSTLTGCTDKNPSTSTSISEETKYTVTFDTNGGSSVESYVSTDGYVTRPTNPTRENYNFINWYKDKELTVPFDFSSKISSDITLYAKWAIIPNNKTAKLSLEGVDSSGGRRTYNNLCFNYNAYETSYVSLKKETLDYYFVDSYSFFETKYKVKYYLLNGGIDHYNDYKYSLYTNGEYTANDIDFKFNEESPLSVKLIYEVSDITVKLYDYNKELKNTYSVNVFNYGDDNVPDANADALTKKSQIENDIETIKSTIPNGYKFASLTNGSTGLNEFEWYFENKYNFDIYVETRKLSEIVIPINFTWGKNSSYNGSYKYTAESFSKEDLFAYLETIKTNINSSSSNYSLTDWYISVNGNQKKLSEYEFGSDWNNEYFDASNYAITAQMVENELTLKGYNVIIEEGTENKKIEEALTRIFNGSDEEYGQTYNIDSLLERKEKYTFEGYFADEDLTIPYSDGTITIEGKGEKSIYAKYSYSPTKVSIDNNPIIKTPSYYSDNIYSDTDVISISFKTTADYDMVPTLNYTMDNEKGSVLGVVTVIDDDVRVAQFNISLGDFMNHEYTVNSITFGDVVNEVTGESLNIELNKTLEKLDFTGFEKKDIIVSAENFFAIKSTNAFKEMLTTTEEWEETMNAPQNVGNSTAKYVINANIYQYGDLNFYSQTLFDLSFFGRDYVLNGNYDLNGQTLSFNFNGDGKVMMFEALNGTLSNGTVNFSGNRTAYSVRNNFEGQEVYVSLNNTYYRKDYDETLYLNCDLFAIMYNNSNVNNVTINANNLGYKFANGQLTNNVNYVIGVVGQNCSFNGTTIYEGYNFELDEASKNARTTGITYNLTNEYGTIRQINWTESETPVLDRNGHEYIGITNITGLNIFVEEFKVSDFIKNNSQDVDVTYQNSIYSKINESTEVTYNAKNFYFTQTILLDYEETAITEKGKYTPNVYLLARAFGTYDEPICPDGCHREVDEDGWGTYVPNSEMVMNDIALYLGDLNLSDINEAKTNFEHFIFITGYRTSPEYVQYTTMGFDSYYNSYTTEEVLTKLGY